MSNLFEWEGFSHKIILDLFKISIALIEMSCKFPIGVATKYKPLL